MTGELVPFRRAPRIRPVADVLPELRPFRLVQTSPQSLYMSLEEEMPLSRVRALISMLEVYVDRLSQADPGGVA